MQDLARRQSCILCLVFLTSVNTPYSCYLQRSFRQKYSKDSSITPLLINASSLSIKCNITTDRCTYRYLSTLLDDKTEVRTHKCAYSLKLLLELSRQMYVKNYCYYQSITQKVIAT